MIFSCMTVGITIFSLSKSMTMGITIFIIIGLGQMSLLKAVQFKLWPSKKAVHFVPFLFPESEEEEVEYK